MGRDAPPRSALLWRQLASLTPALAPTFLHASLYPRAGGVSPQAAGSVLARSVLTGAGASSLPGTVWEEGAGAGSRAGTSAVAGASTIASDDGRLEA